MSSSPKRAFGSSAKSKRKEVNLELSTARQMLPLVRCIVQDIVDKQSQLLKLEPEQDSLDRHRRDLVWAERERRYRIHEEILGTEKAIKSAVGELNDLGVVLIQSGAAEVVFPTRINGRPAVFSWQIGEDNVNHWNYEDESLRRPIPADWTPGTPLRLKGKP